MMPREELRSEIALLYKHIRSIKQIKSNRQHCIENIKTCIRYLADEDDFSERDNSIVVYVLEKQLEQLAQEDRKLAHIEECQEDPKSL